MLLWSGFTTELKHFDMCTYYVNLELFWQIPAEKQATEIGQMLALREIPVLRFPGIGDILPQYLRYYKDLEPKKLVLFHLMWTLFYGRDKFWTESKFWSWSSGRFLLGQPINSFGLHTGISMGSDSESICFIIPIFSLYLNNFSDYRKIFIVSY